MGKDNRLSTDTTEVVHAMVKIGLGAIPYAGEAPETRTPHQLLKRQLLYLMS